MRPRFTGESDVNTIKKKTKTKKLPDKLVFIWGFAMACGIFPFDTPLHRLHFSVPPNSERLHSSDSFIQELHICDECDGTAVNWSHGDAASLGTFKKCLGRYLQVLSFTALDSTDPFTELWEDPKCSPQLPLRPFRCMFGKNKLQCLARYFCGRQMIAVAQLARGR